jgi:hypothetical protein
VELQNVEAVVRRLFSDSEFRSTAIKNPDAALAEYELAAEEHSALMNLCSKLDKQDGIGVGPMGTWW